MSEGKQERTITKEAYWQATGLLTLAHKYNDMLLVIEETLNQTLGSQKTKGSDYYEGQVSDAIFNGYSIDTLLQREGIVVQD